MNRDSRKLKALQQALQEFEDFKKGNTLPAIKTERAATVGTPPRADKMLYCATHPGFAGQMILKIEPGTAYITEICKLHHKRSFTAQRDSGPDDAVLRTHKLNIDNYKGCPHCGSHGIVYCSSCNTLSCLGPDEQRHICPCCNRAAALNFSGINVGITASPPARAAMQALPRNASQFLLPASGKKL